MNRVHRIERRAAALLCAALLAGAATACGEPEQVPTATAPAESAAPVAPAAAAAPAETAAPAPAPAAPAKPISLDPTDAREQADLGLYYSLGSNGLPKDPVKGAAWYRKSAEQGDSIGQARLALAYQEGKGVAKSQTEALEWFRKAAKQGHPRAFLELGIAYRDGDGVEKDKVEGLKYMILSSQAGSLPSQVMAPALARTLTPEQRKDAHRRAYAYRIEAGLTKLGPKTIIPGEPAGAAPAAQAAPGAPAAGADAAAPGGAEAAAPPPPSAPAAQPPGGGAS